MFGFSCICSALRLPTKPHMSKSVPEARREKLGVEMWPRSNRRKSNVHKFQLIFSGNCRRSTSNCPIAREVGIALPQHPLVNLYLAHRVLPRGWTTTTAISQKKPLRGSISQQREYFFRPLGSEILHARLLYEFSFRGPQHRIPTHLKQRVL